MSLDRAHQRGLGRVSSGEDPGWGKRGTAQCSSGRELGKGAWPQAVSESLPRTAQQLSRLLRGGLLLKEVADTKEQPQGPRSYL